MIWISQPHKTIYYVQLVQLFRQYLTFLRFYICLKNHLIDLVGRNNARDATCDQPTEVRTDWQRLGWAVVLYRNIYPLCPAWSSTPLVITVTLSLRSHYRPCWANTVCFMMTWSSTITSQQWTVSIISDCKYNIILYCQSLQV